MDLVGSRLIVAGATGNVGGALAREFARRGAEVGLLGRDRDRLDRLADELGGVPTARFEATEPATCTTAVDAVAAALEGLDGCVVAHGAVAFGPAADTEDDVTAALLAINAAAPIALLRAALRHIDGPGALAAVTAVVAEHPTAGMAPYSASKAALSAYLTALRREVRRAGVSVLDARLPHLDSDFAERPLAGTPPRLPEGLPVAEVAVAIADAVADGKRDLSWQLTERRLLAS